MVCHFWHLWCSAQKTQPLGLESLAQSLWLSPHNLQQQSVTIQLQIQYPAGLRLLPLSPGEGSDSQKFSCWVSVCRGQWNPRWTRQLWFCSQISRAAPNQMGIRKIQKKEGGVGEKNKSVVHKSFVTTEEKTKNAEERTVNDDLWLTPIQALQ